MEIGRVPTAMFMASRAREHCVIARIRMAVRAGSIRVVTVIHREVGVIESCVQPIGCVVADRACGWEASGHVIRIAGSLVFSLMASVTVSRQCRVIVVHVTVCASDRRVSAGQREAGVVMVEGS